MLGNVGSVMSLDFRTRIIFTDLTELPVEYLYNNPDLYRNRLLYPGVCKVLDIVDKGIEDTIMLRFKSGMTLQCTQDHPIVVGYGTPVEATFCRHGIIYEYTRLKNDHVAELSYGGECRVYDVVSKDSALFIANNVVVQSCH